MTDENIIEQIDHVPPGEQGEQDANIANSSEAENETQDTDETQEQTDKPKKEFWAKKRIDELTREKYEAKRAAEQAIAEAQQLREALQSGQIAQPDMQQIQTLVQQQAAAMAAEERFNNACNKTYADGVKEFPDFNNAVANLQMIGVNRDFLEIVSSSDAGAKVLHHLGNDLDEAARIASLPPVQMARELTRLEFKLSSTPKKQSTAPAPIEPLAAKGAATKDPSKMTDAEFAKWRREQIAQRR